MIRQLSMKLTLLHATLTASRTHLLVILILLLLLLLLLLLFFFLLLLHLAQHAPHTHGYTHTHTHTHTHPFPPLTNTLTHSSFLSLPSSPPSLYLNRSIMGADDPHAAFKQHL